MVVRGDLPFGHACAQVAHAAAESVVDPVPPGTHAVILRADSEDELRQLAAKLDRRGIPHKLICEPDAPYLGSAVALGVAPTNDRRAVRRVLGHLKLIGAEHGTAEDGEHRAAEGGPACNS